jgi:hypothetical protein
MRLLLNIYRRFFAQQFEAKPRKKYELQLNISGVDTDIGQQKIENKLIIKLAPSICKFKKKKKKKIMTRRRRQHEIIY